MLKQIKLFLELANYMNFSKTAEKTFMTQQAITRNISSLEEELGVKLFNRSTRSVTLTEAGIICRNEFTKIIDIYDRTKEYVQNVSLANTSSVTIGFYEFFSRTDIIVPTIEMLSEKFTDVEFNIRLYDFGNLRQQLMDGTIDLCIALSSDWKYWPSVKVISLQKQPFKVVVSKKHPLAAFSDLQFDELRKYNWMALDNLETIRAAPAHWLSRVPCKAKTPVGNFLTVLANVEAGLGFSCLTPVFQGIKSNTLKLFFLPFEDAYADFICVYREDMINPLVLSVVKQISLNFNVSLEID